MFEHSESIKNISLALLWAQDKLGGVSENANNPFFHSKYADLGEHIKTIKPVFSECGLVMTQFPICGNGEVGVMTMVVHPESGEWMKSTALLPLEDEKGNSKAQTAGKIISYLRRYMQAAIANVYAGDDNDGNIVPVYTAEEKELAKFLMEIIAPEFEMTPPAVMNLLNDYDKNVNIATAAKVITYIKENGKS